MSSPVQVSAVRILSASADPVVSSTREAVLRQHGFDVVTSLSRAEALELIRRQRFDLLIFGNSLSSETCTELAAAFRVRNPRGRIIEILLNDSSHPLNRPDAMVVGAEGPEALLDTLREQLENI